MSTAKAPAAPSDRICEKCVQLMGRLWKLLTDIIFCATFSDKISDHVLWD